MYRLKEGIESFRVVDGPDEGKKFLKGKEYAEVPAGEKGKFEKIRVTSDEKIVTSDEKRVTRNEVKGKKTRNS